MKISKGDALVLITDILRSCILHNHEDWGRGLSGIANSMMDDTWAEREQNNEN